MDLTPYVENLRGALLVAAEAGGDEARALAERLSAPLESSVRLTLLDALSDAADEITRELAPGSVELRLRSGEPEFAVARAVEPAEEPDEAPPPPEVEDAATARINLRLPESLKSRGRAGRRPRAAVGQRLADPGHRRRGGVRRPPATPARRAHRPVLQGVGAMTFETPRPVLATIGLVVGELRLVAGERDTTTVEVRPSDAPTRRTSRPPRRHASSARAAG